MEQAQATATRDHAAAAPCWSCQAPAGGGHFCARCGKIQPLPRGTDHFLFFGLPRKLWIEMGELEARFHQLSWKLHPDNFVRASAYEGELSLERASQLNDAYRALREPVSRVEYLLELEGVRKEGSTKQQAPPELLEEVFELNESLAELRSARAAHTEALELTGLLSRLEEARRSFEQRLEEVDAQLMQAAREWDAALDAAPDAGRATAGRAVLERMNEILNRRSYIRNLVRGVTEELAN
jgi:molecular chaperone HscB